MYVDIGFLNKLENTQKNKKNADNIPKTGILLNEVDLTEYKQNIRYGIIEKDIKTSDHVTPTPENGKEIKNMLRGALINLLPLNRGLIDLDILTSNNDIVI